MVMGIVRTSCFIDSGFEFEMLFLLHSYMYIAIVMIINYHRRISIHPLYSF